MFNLCNPSFNALQFAFTILGSIVSHGVDLFCGPLHFSYTRVISTGEFTVKRHFPPGCDLCTSSLFWVAPDRNVSSGDKFWSLVRIFLKDIWVFFLFLRKEFWYNPVEFLVKPILEAWSYLLRRWQVPCVFFVDGFLLASFFSQVWNQNRVTT